MAKRSRASKEAVSPFLPPAEVMSVLRHSLRTEDEVMVVTTHYGSFFGAVTSILKHSITIWCDDRDREVEIRFYQIIKAIKSPSATAEEK